MQEPSTTVASSRGEARGDRDTGGAHGAEGGGEAVRLAALACDAPMALLWLRHADGRQSLNALGLEMAAAGHAIAFGCAALEAAEPLVVADASEDARFSRHPLVAGEPRVRFIATVPVRTPDGASTGALCAMDGRPRQLAGRAVAELQALAARVGAELPRSGHGQEAPAHEAHARVAASLQNQRAFLQGLLDCIADGIAVVDEAGRVVLCNAAAEGLLGTGMAGAPSEGWAAALGAFVEEGGPLFAAEDLPFRRVARGGTVAGMEMFLRNAQAPAGRWVLVAGRPLHDAAGRATGGVLVLRDCTESRRAVRALLESENRHRLMFEESPVPMWVHEIGTGRILAANEAALAEYGFAREEFLALTLSALVVDSPATPDGTPPRRPLFRHRRKDGSVFFTEVTTSEIDFEGREARLVQARNITDRVFAEERLEQSERRYRVLFENSPVPAAVWEPATGRLLAVNDATVALLGYTRDELLQRRVQDVIDPTQLPAVEAQLAALPLERPFSGPWKLRTKGGQMIHVEWAGSAVTFDSKAARLLQLRDVTDRVKAEAALHREREVLRGVLASLADGFVSVDREWLIRHVNAAGERLLRGTQEELTGAELWRRAPGLAGTHFETALREAMQTGAPAEVEGRFEAWDAWIEMRAFAIDGGLAVYFRDITERRRRSDALRDLTAGLAHTAGADFFDELVLRLTVTLQATGVFVAEFAGPPPHDVRPISVFHDGAFEDNQPGALACGLCHDLLEEDSIMVPDDLHLRQPGSSLVQRWGLRSFLGVALKTPEHATVGLIAAVFRTPVRNPEAAMEVLQLFALRAAAELERRRTIELLRENEERFKLVAQTTADAVWDWDLVRQTMWWSDGFEKLFGATGGEPPTTAIWEGRIHPDDVERVVKGIHAVIDGAREHWEDEYRFRRSDGSYAFVIDRGFVLRDSAGRGVRMVGGMTDMTERLQAEQRLRDQSELLDRASDGILVRDLGGRILYWNRGAERLYGWTPLQAVGRNMRELVCKDVDEFDQATAHVLAHGEWTGEMHHRDARKRDLTVLARWTLMRTPDGAPRSILAINTDVTEKKRLEAQFLRAQRLESIGVLAGGIAHDLNNMLTPITMAVDMLKRLHRNDDATSLVEAIENSARRGADLVRQVLGFTRGVEGRRLDINPGFLVRDIAKIARETFPKNIRIVTDLPLEPWLVPGDPTQLHQVLLNLCVNARDAMPAGGEITLSVENLPVDEHYASMREELRAGHYSVMGVADTGTGIDESIRERIFDPFFTTKEPGKGTGLGLSTVLAIVKSHGGWVDLHSEVGRGTTFRVFLPATAGATALAAEKSEVNLPRGNGELLLVVDDEAAIRTISRQTLEAFGYSVVVASDGAEGLAAYVQNSGRVALVLTDMMMPIMDGPALIRALQRVDPKVRIVAASGLNAEAMVARAAEAGVTRFLPKPYTAETMLKMLDAALHPAAPPP